jgi:hypothetical protein
MLLSARKQRAARYTRTVWVLADVFCTWTSVWKVSVPATWLSVCVMRRPLAPASATVTTV